MRDVIWDTEDFSAILLLQQGTHIYAKDPSTGVHFFYYAVEDDEPQIWRPGDPVPEPFANPDGYRFVAHNFTFDHAILQHVLVPHYGFTPIPLTQQDCTMRRALANGYPGELGLLCAALGLPYRKDPAARAAMLRLSKPLSRRKKKDPAATAKHENDLALVEQRARTDVLSTRAVYRSPLLRPLSPGEREQMLLDVVVNETGVRANVPFLEAVRDLSVAERNAVNVRINELTAGVVSTVDQVAKIKQVLAAHGHDMTTVGKAAVADALASNPDEFVEELLKLRQQGAYASVRMAKRLLGYADPEDQRIRGALRYCGAGTGRWTSPGPQLQNLNRNGDKIPGHLVDAVLAGNRAELARYGNPLAVASGLSRAALCASPGHTLICADFGAIESRVLAWLASETWKLDAYREYDRLTASKDKAAKIIEPYRITAAQMLRKAPADIGKPERQLGKCAELACGFGGSVGAWRRIAPGGDKGRTDAEILAIVKQWRQAHPNVEGFWNHLAEIARMAIRFPNTSISTADFEYGKNLMVAAMFDGETLRLTLPSGHHSITYPGACLIPNRKYENGDPDVEFFDNSKGQWRRTRAWFGTLVENVVQGIARDLLAAALLRCAARGWRIVFHCHDEIVIEAAEGTTTPDEVLACTLEPPDWAADLPLAGSVHAGPLYFEEPDEPAEPKHIAAPDEDDRDLVADITKEVEQQLDDLVGTAEPLPATRGIEQGAEDDFLASLGKTQAPLWDFVTLPMTSGNKVACPFHDDEDPSCAIHADYFYCHGCHTHGTRLDWLVKVEGMTRAEAITALQDWNGPVTATVENDRPSPERRKRALALWDAAKPWRGTDAETYLRDTRGVDTAALPPIVDEAMRFLKRCPFGSGVMPCLVALMRDPMTDEPVGIHRIALSVDANGKVDRIERRAMGTMGVVKLWPLNGDGRLVTGEGLETVLAAASRIPWQGAPLTPAWSLISANGVAGLPVIDGVSHLIQLIDNDANGEGQKAAETGRLRWQKAGRTVVPLIPHQVGWDFNDVILKGLST
jgi:DNA polymerase